MFEEAFKIVKMDKEFNFTFGTLKTRHKYCQARVQVPNPLSQQAPNPDPKVRPSLNKTKYFRLRLYDEVN